jgi:hypothetical protein
LVNEGKIAFEDVQVGAADSAGQHANEEMAIGESGHGSIFKAKDWFAGRFR